MILIMYQPTKNKIELWSPHHVDMIWSGPPWIVWNRLEDCFRYGWEVVGTL